jgi:outer membrane protein
MLKNFLLSKTFLAILITGATYHQAIAAAPSPTNDNPLLVKIRGQYLSTGKKTSYIPDLASTNVSTSSKGLVSSSIGIEAAAAYFVLENYALEASLSLVRNRLATPANLNGAGTYSQVNVSGSNKVSYMMPATLIAQYHFSPEDSFSPYAGAGYSYIIPVKKTKLVDFGRMHGMVAQVGFDLFDSDDLGMNIDVKKYLIKSKGKLKYLTNQSNQPLGVKYDFSPWVFSAGLSVRL